MFRNIYIYVDTMLLISFTGNVRVNSNVQIQHKCNFFFIFYILNYGFFQIIYSM